MRHLSKLAVFLPLATMSILVTSCTAAGLMGEASASILSSVITSAAGALQSADEGGPARDGSGDFCDLWRRCMNDHDYSTCSRWMPGHVQRCSGGGGCPPVGR